MVQRPLVSTADGSMKPAKVPGRVGRPSTDQAHDRDRLSRMRRQRFAKL